MNETLKNKAVIVAEDDAFLANLLSIKLQKEGADVALVESGEDCLIKCAKDRPDLIMIDILLPGIDGIKTIEIIRQQEKLKNVPIVLLSNLEQQEYKDRIKSLGKVALLMKSNYNLDELIKEIEKFLNN